MTRLYVIGRYRSALASYEPGQVLDLSDDQARALLADSPGAFSTADPVAPRLPDAPPRDTMIRRGKRK